MPRHYRKSRDQPKGVKTYDDEMKKLNEPKPVKENNIFEDYSILSKDKKKGKNKIKKNNKK